MTIDGAKKDVGRSLGLRKSGKGGNVGEKKKKSY